MAKESSLQIFPFDLLVKGAYYVVKILHKYNMKIFLDTDSYSDTDSTKHNFDLSNQPLNDY